MIFSDRMIVEEKKMSELIIRFAKDTDLDRINELLYQVHKVHSDARPDLFKQGAKKYTDEEVLKIINDSHYKVFVADIDSKVVGYAFCIIKEEESNSLCHIKTLYVDDLCVDKEIRGKHIGSSLFNSVCDYAKKNNFYNVTLNVWASNKEALKFYEKIGLQIQKIGMEKIL